MKPDPFLSPGIVWVLHDQIHDVICGNEADEYHHRDKDSEAAPDYDKHGISFLPNASDQNARRAGKTELWINGVIVSVDRTGDSGDIKGVRSG